MTILAPKRMTLLATCLCFITSGAALVAAQGTPSASVDPTSSGKIASGRISVIAEGHRREFLDARECFTHYLDASVLSSGMNSCSRHKGVNSEQCARWSKALEESSKANASSRGCSGDPSVLEREFRKAVIIAAKDGDEDARICYVDGAFFTPKDVDIDEYRVNAHRYLKEAIERGDWRAVALLAKDSPDHDGMGVMSSMDIIGKPFTLYRANRLLQLGAADGLKKIYADNARVAAQRLTNAQIVNANVWAAQVYSKYFDKSSKLTSNPSGCMRN